MNTTVHRVRTATYIGPYQANYHEFRDETGETHFLNHAPRDIKVGQQVVLAYCTDRTSGLWYAELPADAVEPTMTEMRKVLWDCIVAMGAAGANYNLKHPQRAAWEEARKLLARFPVQV